MTLITDLIEISTFLQFILLKIILVDNKLDDPHREDTEIYIGVG